MRRFWWLTVSLMAVSSVLTGCAGVGTPSRESPDDQQTTRAVKAALAADGTPTLNQINVRTTGGRVTLTGWGSAAAATRARNIAGSVAGAQNVVDLIIVPSTNAR